MLLMVGVTNILYHVTPAENIESILANGLQPSIGQRSLELGEDTPAIYLFRSLEDIDNALGSWLGRWFDEHYTEPIELKVLKIFISKESESQLYLYDDPVSFEVISYSTIPTDYISVIDNIC